MKPLYFIGILAVFLLISCIDSIEVPPSVIKGTIDLSHWDFQKSGPVNLIGSWEFYGNELLTPQDFIANSIARSSNYIEVPGLWGRQPGINLKGEGCATYRLNVLLMPGQPQIVVKIPELPSSFRLWINGKETLQNGVVARSKSESVGGPGSKWALVPPTKDRLELVLQTSNYFHRDGGLWQPPHIGDAKGEMGSMKMDSLADGAVAGCLLIVAFYHIVLFWQHKKSYFNLYFAAFCLCIAVRTSVVGDGELFCSVFQNAGWLLARRMEYLGFYLSLIFIASFFRAIFPVEFKPWLWHGATWPSLIFSLVVALFPVEIFAHTVIAFEGYTAVLTMIGMVALLKAALARREGAILILMGFTFLAFTIVQDILYANAIIRTTYMAQYGLLVLVFIQSVIISSRFSKAFSQIEEAQKELNFLNDNLDKKVIDRTIALTKANYDLKLEIEHRQKIERENAEIQTKLFRSDKLATIGTLAAGIAHEINNPLTIVKGFTGMLARRMGILSSADENEKIVETIDKAIGRITTIVNSLRTYARGDTEHVEAVDIHLVINEVITFVYQITKNAGVEIHQKLAAEALHVRGNIGKIQQVLVNLLTNACDALSVRPQGRMILIETFSDKDGVTIRLTDNGPGIPVDIIDKIFDPFFTTKPVGKGTGLGLSISRSIIESFGGTFQVSSPSGQGAAFQIRLLRSDAASPVVQAHKTITPVLNLRGEVLIIDDEPDLCILIKSFLDEEGLSVTTVLDGSVALELMKEKIFDLVITDMQMPGLFGVNLIKKMRELKCQAEAKFIVITGGITTAYCEEDRAYLRDAVHGYLLKPFERETLIEMVSSLLLTSAKD